MMATESLNSHSNFFSGEGIIPDGFWEAIQVWIERPHVVNNRLMIVKAEALFSLTKSDKLDFTDINQIRNSVQKMRNLDCSPENILEAIKLCGFNVQQEMLPDASCINLRFKSVDNNNNIIIIYRHLFPKQPKIYKKAEEIVVLDKGNNIVIFCSVSQENSMLCIPPFIYSLSLIQERICLAFGPEQLFNAQDAGAVWLQDKLLPKLSKWALSASLPNYKSKLRSLSLIPGERYTEVYQDLKVKHGKRLTDLWTESTDPQKFIYEDLAIAAYLMVLWEKERMEKKLLLKQSFVDLGCGNGLLVHVLTAEGHRGIGVDVQKRKIWDIYGTSTELIETAITPSNTALFADYDWIIGNHSDELTPWIPTIATRSSYNARVFLLPCCAYDFNGKYVRTHGGISLYQSYLNYVEEICLEMGFSVQRDRLRIPSTKRICFICASRTYDISQEAEMEIRRIRYIQMRTEKQAKLIGKKENENDLVSATCSNSSHTKSTRQPISANAVLNDSSKESKIPGAENFKVREKQKVMNCTQLDRKFLHDVVNKIVNILLTQEKLCPDLEENQPWNKGGSLHLEVLAKRLEPKTLKELKKQCGGLQTLIRNHKHVLKVEKGIVSINVPEPYSKDEKFKMKSKKRDKSKLTVLRSKPCWFFNYHPQGCPLSTEDCSYAHHT